MPSSVKSARRTTAFVHTFTKLSKAICSKRSNPMNVLRPHSFTRRHFLRAAGVTLALPLLECFQPRGRAAAGAKPILRMVCVFTPLGIHAPFFFPEQAGKDYQFSRYLEPLKD